MSDKEENIRVFISSLEEELACEREFAVRATEGLYLKPKVFAIRSEEFLASPRPDEYIYHLRKSDFVVLILGKKFSPFVKKEIDEANRLGKHLLVFVKDVGKKRRNKELKRLIEELKTRVRYVRYDNMREFEDKVRRSITNEINRLFLSAPKSFGTIRSMYEYATEIISKTQRELYTVEKHPILLFGLHKKTPEHEKYYKVLDSWVKKYIMKGRTSRFYSIYSLDQTREIIDRMRRSGISIKRIKDKLKYYWELQSSTHGRFKLYPIKGRVNPFIVGDDEFGVWFSIGKAQLGISFVNKEVSSRLKDEIERLTQEQKDLNTLIAELG